MKPASNIKIRLSTAGLNLFLLKAEVIESQELEVEIYASIIDLAFSVLT